MYKQNSPKLAQRRQQQTPEPKPRTTGGSMSMLHKFVLRTNRVTIINELESSILDHMFEKGTIKRDHMQVIKEEKTEKGKASRLLDILEGRGSRAFSVLLEGLNKTQDHLADMLEQMEDEAAEIDESVIRRYVQEGYSGEHDRGAVAKGMDETDFTTTPRPRRTASNSEGHTEDTSKSSGAPFGPENRGENYIREQTPREQRVKELEKHIRDLEENAHINEQKLEHSKKDYDDLKSKLETAQDEIDYWRELYIDLNQRHTDQAKRLRTQANLKNTRIKEDRDKEREMDNANLRTEISSKEREISMAKEALQEKAALLSEAEGKLQSMMNEETRLKKKLDLPPNASRRMVRHSIKMLKEKASHNTDHLERVNDELEKAQNRNMFLEKRVFELKRESESLHFDLRQKECEYQRLVNRQDPLTADLLEKRKKKKKVSVVFRGKLKTRPELKQDESSRTVPTDDDRSPSPSKYRTDFENFFCLLCRNEFEFGKDLTCAIHYRPQRGRKWSCCGEDRHSLIQSGCMTLPHLFLREEIDGVYVTTDGSNSIKMKDF